MKKSDAIVGRRVHMKGTAAYGYVAIAPDATGQTKVYWNAGHSTWQHFRKLENAETISEAEKATEQRNADHVDGYDRDDLGESPDF